MLVAVFTYLESNLGNKWIERHGGNQQPELECLRTIRNAFVHTNSNILELSSISQGEIDNVKSFILNLEKGKITDDNGDVYPKYVKISKDGYITLSRDALDIFVGMIRAISH